MLLLMSDWMFIFNAHSFRYATYHVSVCSSGRVPQSGGAADAESSREGSSHGDGVRRYRWTGANRYLAQRLHTCWRYRPTSAPPPHRYVCANDYIATASALNTFISVSSNDSTEKFEREKKPKKPNKNKQKQKNEKQKQLSSGVSNFYVNYTNVLSFTVINFSTESAW